MKARVAYAALFVIVLPALLAAWAMRLDALLTLPAYTSPVFGSLLATAGIGLMVMAARELWVTGGGLPASPFPPERLVKSGVYSVVAHPIYLGAVIAGVGVSLAAGSPAGLWVVTPVLALSATAWVIGFERDATRARFGALPSPSLRLPENADRKPARAERLSVYLLVFLPWLFLYGTVELLGVAADARSTYSSWERSLPLFPWTEGVYAFTYPFVLLAPFAARSASDLARFARDGLWATIMILPFYLILPFIAEAKPVIGDGFWQTLMRWERQYDQPVTAFPSFHIVWFMLAARLYSARWQWMRRASPLLVAVTAVSCITTGMHSLADVAAGLIAYAAVVNRDAIWRSLCDFAERVANSWSEFGVGPLRLMSHGLYAALGTLLGLIVATFLAGTENAGWLAAMAVAAALGAGLWAQLIEGSSQLLRPFGYFGAPVGVAAVALVAAGAGANAWLLFVAFGTGSCFTQAAGRLRCLVQGCCHGRPAPESLGIRYCHPMSRVVRLSDLGGVPVHPAPLYSIVWIMVVGAVLLRLWSVGPSLQFTAGVYFMLVGIGRFVEEHFRGEPQTAVYGGLRLYQWLAIAFIVIGASLTTLPPSFAEPARALDPASFPVLILPAVLIFLAFGVDVPQSNRRFSRLR